MKPVSWQKSIQKLSSPSLHIVSFDVPFPPDYGGAIDVYYRIKALHDLGVKITLHTYEYGRGEAPELEEVTEKVFYYTRKKHFFDSLSKLPFIVQSRRSKKLLERLLNDKSPILFEGLHTTFFLGDERLKDRIKLVRTHNVEHEYYGHLADNSAGIDRRFFRGESKKLARYEPILKHADHILPISSADLTHFTQYDENIQLLPPCFAEFEHQAQQDTIPYVLFHGNLSVSENAKSVQWLARNVFTQKGVRFIVAGKNPGEQLVALQASHKFELIANPSSEEMHELIANARVHALHTDQSTGVKLKLIQSLQTSGHLVVNSTMVAGTDLENYCSVVEAAKEWKSAIQNALRSELKPGEFAKRIELFQEDLNTLKSCRVITTLIDPSI
ncbi:MAG: hypothetical protein ACI837_000304 [Crocinitomicaceae bacterium]|jgi:hypothetical protein